MDLSIVIICWNDWKVIENCLRSIFDGTHRISFEVIVSDNGSTDGSSEQIERAFPAVRLLRNGDNLGFARGNNAGIAAASGRYVLILNPDTLVHDGSLDRWLDFADGQPKAGAFGCLVLNRDGSLQRSARPFPTLRRDRLASLYLRQLARLSDRLIADTYIGWDGDTVREIDWQSGCCVLVRGELLRQLGGFDEQFFYHYEEVDLCRRVWNAGFPIVYTPDASITHLGGQSVGRFPLRFALERQRNRYRYFYKHFGVSATAKSRRIALTSFRIRRLGHQIIHWIRPSAARSNRLAMYRAVIDWTEKLDPVRFVERGEEPASPALAAH